MSDLWGTDNLFDAPTRRRDPFGFMGGEDDFFTERSRRQSLESKILEAEAMAKAYKIKVPEQPNKKLRLWDLLEWARYPITNMIYTAARESKEDGLAFNDIGKILKSAWYGITLKERHNTEDYLRILFPKAPEWVIKVAGLAGDIVTDPTTWLSFGAKGGVKAAAELGERGAVWSGKAIKRIAKEGASGAFATRLMEKFGGKTWMEAVSLAKRAQIRQIGKFGLRLGLPFGSGPSVLLAAGGPLEWAAGAAKAAGATKLAGGLQRLPVAIQQLPIISGIRKAFSPEAKFGLLPEAHQIERNAMREASFRIETTMSNLRDFEKSVDGVLVPRAAKFGAGPKGRNTLLEAVWRHNENIAAGKKAVLTLPQDVADMDTKLRAILDDIWQGMETRGMTTKAPKLEAYYPRFYKNQAGELRIVGSKKYSSAASFLNLRQIETRAQAEVWAKAHGYKAVEPLEGLQMYAHRAARAIQNHDLVEGMVKQYGTIWKGAPREGFERLTVPGFKKYVAPEEVSSVLNQTQKILLDPDELTKAGKYLSKVQNWWKRWATIYNPGFHARNAISNVWTGAFKDGIGPRQLANQLKATVINTWEAHPDKLISVTLGGKKVKKTAKELYEMLRKAGVHTGGFAAADLGEAAIRQAAGALERAGGAAGGFIENTARVASALNDMDKGLELAAAAKRVNFYFLDYGDLTKVEEKIRKLIPFYCVPDDCEILTADGWLKVDQLQPGKSMALAYDIQTDAARWEPLRGVATFEYNGQLLNLNGFSFTPDHKWPVRAFGGKRKIIKGYELKSGHRIPLVASSMEWSRDCPITENEAKIVGWLLTDGYIRQASPGSWEYMIYQKKQPFRDEIRVLLGKDASESEHPGTGTGQFRINGPTRKRLQEIITSKEEAFRLLDRLNEKCAVALWETMYKGDGTIPKQRKDRRGLTDLFFAAKESAGFGRVVGDFFQALSILRGFPANKSGRGMYIKKGSRVMRVNSRLGVEWYKGRIWCPELGGLCWMIRRNGKHAWTSNTWLKKNLTVQIHEFVTNPGKYTAWTTKPLRALNMLPEDQAQYMPDWMREDLYINPLGAKGAFGSPLMLNPNLPFQDLGRLGIDVAHPFSRGGPIGAAANTIMEGLTPFLKVPFEVMLNRSGFTGQPLQYTDYDYRPAPPLIRLTVGNLPQRVQDALGVKSDADGNMVMPGKWVYALSALLPMLKTGGGIERYIQTMTGAGMPEYRAERAPWDMLSRVGGLKFRPFDVGYYKEKQLLERLKQLKGLTSLTGDGL